MTKFVYASVRAFTLLCSIAFMGSAQLKAVTEASVILEKLDQPVFLFKTTAKDPYFMVYRPGAAILEIVLFGYYSGTGAHVHRVTKAEQLAKVVPISMTKLYEDGVVKIVEKYVGYRESLIAKTYEDIFKAIGVMPDPYYKGTPFVDQYREAMPMKWVFNNARELSALRKFLEPLFAKEQLLAKGVKPVLVVELESTINGGISAEDYDFLNTYFELVDLTNPAVKDFFAWQQKQILLAVAKIKDAKQVKEGFADILFRQMEDVTKEFKAKELGAIIVGSIVSAVTVKVIEKYVGELTHHAKEHAHANFVKPVVGRVVGTKREGKSQPKVSIEIDGVKYCPQKEISAVAGPEEHGHTARNGALIAGGLLGAGLLITAGACAATTA